MAILSDMTYLNVCVKQLRSVAGGSQRFRTDKKGSGQPVIVRRLIWFALYVQ